MIKVCFLLGGFEGNGGIGRVTSIIANELSKNSEFEVHTVSYIDSYKNKLYVLSPNIRTHHLFEMSISMSKAMLFNHAVKKMKNIINENDLNIVVCCGALFFPLGVLACKFTKAKCYCWEHINPSTKTDYKFQGICEKIGIKKSDRLIVLTKAAKKYYINQLKISKNKVVQIYNPVLPCNNDICYNSCSKKIISVGRLGYQKNFELLVDIANVILKEFPDWRWDIYGEGEYRRQLQDKINRLGLTGKLTLKGQVNNLYELYPQYSFLVMTSRYEGFPMTLLEGMSAGLPLISFDVPTGPNEIICDKINGFLVPALDKKKMADKIRELINDENKRTEFSKNNLLMKEQFNLDKIIHQWESILK